MEDSLSIHRNTRRFSPGCFFPLMKAGATICITPTELVNLPYIWFISGDGDLVNMNAAGALSVCGASNLQYFLRPSCACDFHLCCSYTCNSYC